jgi:hypothetical protein
MDLSNRITSGFEGRFVFNKTHILKPQISHETHTTPPPARLNPQCPQSDRNP